MKKFIIIILMFLGLGIIYFKFSKPPQNNNVQQVEAVLPPVVQQEIPSAPKTEELPPKKATNYAEAIKLAKIYKQPVFLYFGAEWCNSCKQMKANTLSNSEVKNKLEKDYIVLFIDVDKDEELDLTAQKFKITVIPTYMTISPEETILLKGSGFKSKKDFILWLH